MAQKDKKQLSVQVQYPGPKKAKVKHELHQTDTNFFGTGQPVDWTL